MKRRYAPVPPDELRWFIEAWERCSSVTEVCSLLVISYSTAMGRAKRLRKLGHPLRELYRHGESRVRRPPSRPKLPDEGELRELISSYRRWEGDRDRDHG